MLVVNKSCGLPRELNNYNKSSMWTSPRVVNKSSMWTAPRWVWMHTLELTSTVLIQHVGNKNTFSHKSQQC